jgi:hypothetical protein
LALAAWRISSYDDFRELPILEARLTDLDELLVPGTGLQAVSTTGSAGRRKSVMRRIGSIVSYPPDMHATLADGIPVFLHSARTSPETYYLTHDVNHRRMYPRARLLEYTTGEELRAQAAQGDVLFIIEYPLMGEWICYQLERAMENALWLRSACAKRTVYLELSGEPMVRERVDKLVARMARIFSCDPEYFLTYGASECGHIGTYLPCKHGREIVYEDAGNSFLEEVDGDIVITPFASEGTILLRYRIGDRGAVFFREGQTFVRVDGRAASEGTLYVAGSQVDVRELSSELRLSIGQPAGLQVVKEENSVTGTCGLTILVCGIRMSDSTTRERASLLIRERLHASAALVVEQAMQLVTLRVDFTETPLIKEWMISEIQS